MLLARLNKSVLLYRDFTCISSFEIRGFEGLTAEGLPRTEDGRGISQAEFAALAQAIQEEDGERAWAISEDIVKDCDLDQKAFMKALLALPPLALETLSLDSTPKADPQGTSFSSRGTSFGSLVAPAWVCNSGVCCQSCSITFSCVRRRHHCRACGRLLCNTCSLQRLPLSILGYVAPVRICDDCCLVLCPGQSFHRQ